MNKAEEFLGPFSESLNLPVCDLSKNGVLSEQQITIGFLYELRYKWKLKSHQDVVLHILKLKPGLSKVPGKHLKRKLGTSLNRVKLYMDRNDERLDSYLKQSIMFKIPNSQLESTNSPADDYLYDDLIDENDSSSDNINILPPSCKTTEDSTTMISRNVFKEVFTNMAVVMGNATETESIDSVSRNTISKESTESFSPESVGRNSNQNNETIIRYLRGYNSSTSMELLSKNDFQPKHKEVEGIDSPPKCGVMSEALSNKDQQQNSSVLHESQKREGNGRPEKTQAELVHIQNGEVNLKPSQKMQTKLSLTNDTESPAKEIPTDKSCGNGESVVPPPCKKMKILETCESEPLNDQTQDGPDSCTDIDVQNTDEQISNGSEECNIMESSENRSLLSEDEYPAGSLLQVHCVRDQQVYEAKVLDRRSDGSCVYYLVHYTGWNTRYDEWIKQQNIRQCLYKGDGKRPPKSPKTSFPRHKSTSPVSKNGLAQVPRNNKRKLTESEDKKPGMYIADGQGSLDVNGNNPTSLSTEHESDTETNLVQKTTEAVQDYWPSERKLKIRELNLFLLCSLCNCYLFRATTVTECMHTYCRKCIYYHIENSKKCPQCKAFIDQSNPIAGLREDKMYQQLVDKIMPDIAEREIQSETELNMKHIKTYSKTSGYRKSMAETRKKFDSWISLKLTYIGSSCEVTSHGQRLNKPFLLIPTKACMRNVEKYLSIKLRLDERTKCLLFYSDYILHEDFSLSDLQTLHTQTTDKVEDEPVEVCYGLVPKGPDYFQMLPSNTEFNDNEACSMIEDLSPQGKTTKRGLDCPLCGETLGNMYYHLYQEHNVKDQTVCQNILNQCL